MCVDLYNHIDHNLYKYRGIGIDIGEDQYQRRETMVEESAVKMAGTIAYGCITAFIFLAVASWLLCRGK